MDIIAIILAIIGFAKANIVLAIISMALIVFALLKLINSSKKDNSNADRFGSFIAFIIYLITISFNIATIIK